MTPEPKREDGAEQEPTYERPGHIIDVRPDPPQATKAEQERQAAAHEKQWPIRHAIGRFIKRALKPMSLYTLALTIFAAVQLFTQDEQVAKISGAITTGVEKAKAATDSVLKDNRIAMDAALKANRESLKDALAGVASQNKRSIGATIKQGQRALDFSIRAAQQDQRAWIGVKNVGSVRLEKDKPLVFDILFANSGKTPALKVYSALKYMFRADSMQGPSADMTDFKMEIQQSVAPQGTLNRHVELSSELIAPRYDALKADKMFLYFYGQLTYTDVSESVSGITRYCVFLRPNREPPEFYFCPAFNDMQ